MIPKHALNPMSPAARLAVVLRQAQWDLDNMAYRMPRGEVPTSEREELANTLAELATLLRDSTTIT